MTLFRGIVLFVVVLAAGLVLKMPIGLFLNDSGRIGPVQLFDVQGTVWSGRAAGVQFQDERIESITWDVKPLHLLLGQARAHIQFNYLDGQGALDASVSLGQTAQIENASYRAPADNFAQHFGKGFFGLEGDVELQIDQLTYPLNSQYVEDAKGFVYWQKAGASYPMAGRVGNVSIELQQQAGGDGNNGPLVATLSNQGGELSIDGKATINAARQYTANITLKPTAQITSATQGALDSALRADNQGNYHFRRQGRL
ncbi:bacterial type II secretion system protein N [gamma proteobacterium HTCC5015]|nr:bacterial type II secretion system protein N [gamma proteobacterium HTCC5015]